MFRLFARIAARLFTAVLICAAPAEVAAEVADRAPAVDAPDRSAAPVAVLFNVSGDRVWTRLRVQADLLERVSLDPRLELAEGLPPAVAEGRQRGYQVELRLESELGRQLDGQSLRCAIHQSIFDLRHKNLRGSATQRASVRLSGHADAVEVARAREMCLSALVPVVHEGMHDYLARARR